MSDADPLPDSGDSVTLAELVAYAEGRLPPGLERHARVQTWLRAHPEDGARVRAYAHQNRCIRRAWGDVTLEPIPARLQPARVDTHRTPERGRWMRPTAMAAALVLAAGAGFLAGQADLVGPATEVDSRQGIASQPTAEPLTAVDGSMPGMPAEPLHTPELRIAPVPEMMPAPTTTQDGV